MNKLAQRKIGTFRPKGGYACTVNNQARAWTDTWKPLDGPTCDHPGAAPGTARGGRTARPAPDRGAAQTSARRSARGRGPAVKRAPQGVFIRDVRLTRRVA